MRNRSFLHLYGAGVKSRPGVLILLPVVALSVVGLISLRQDEQAAENDAHRRAAAGVRSLARAMRVSVDEELQRYLTLQNVWRSGMYSASQPDVSGLDFPDVKLQADTEKWERDYPGLNFAALALPQGLILADGRQVEPPDFPAVPAPPKWFRELSPEQRNLWDALRQAVDNRASPAALRAASGNFLKSHPADNAQRAAFDLIQPAKNIAGFSGAFPTETGISFEEIACCRLLSASNAQLTAGLLQSVWWQVIDHPSFLSPKLLALAGALTNRADANLQRKFFWTQQLWSRQSKTREWLNRLQDLPELKEWHMQKSWSDWAIGTGTVYSDALAFFVPCTFTNMGSDVDGTGLSGRGYQVWFVPGKVVEAIFDRALLENKIFIPEYCCAAVTVEGRPFYSAFHQGLMKEKFFDLPRSAKPAKRFMTMDEILAQMHWQLLGTASQQIGAAAISDAGSFDVNFYLTSRAQMLSAERRRARLLAVLILGAVFAALAGLLAAWRAFRRQLQLNELKSNFVSSVSHELRAPIASVRLMAENLERGKIQESQKQNEYFRFIVQECRRLSSLVQNVLDFSRIEQGRKQYEFEPTDLVVLTQTTVKLMEPGAAERGVRLELHSELRTPNSELDLDGRAIQQALVNLIDNAIKHTPKGETVTVGLEFGVRGSGTGNLSALNFQPSTLNIFVADRGPGIPREEQEKIFERFYRRGSELRRETQGVGIGLSVVKHIVEAHGGRVCVESEPGCGSRFTIELPARNPNE